MLISLPARDSIPATRIFVEHLTKPSPHTRDTMLMLPGGPGGNHSVYDSIRDELLEYVDLILIDPRGCGLSDPADLELCGMEVCADDIQAIKTHFGLNNFILFGGSYGAIVALCYASKYQDLKKLILLGGATSFRFFDKAWENIQRLGSTEQIEAVQKLWRGEIKNQEECKDYYTKMASLYSKKISNQAPSMTKRFIPYNLDLMNYGFSGFLRKFDLQSCLHEIRCSTLILFGRDDWINDPSEGKIMAKLIPHNKLVVLEDCSHLIWVDQPELLYKELSDFLTRDEYEQ
ncbi:MAG: pip 1 [Gammaproteobacteria bacterium]|jgi:proline iminopeptidase|nr:pip 1 [Gammaproteobacteria bacterium]